MLAAMAYALAAVFHKGLGFLLFLGLAHALPQEDYAVFGLFYALQSGLIALMTAGVVELAIGQHRAYSERQAQRELHRLSNGVLVWLSALAVLATLGIYFGFLIQRATPWDLAAIYVGSVLLAFFSLQSSLVRLDEAHRLSLLLSFVPPVLGLVAAYVGFVVWGTLTAFFSGMALTLLVLLLVLQHGRLVRFEVDVQVSRRVSLRGEIAPYLIIALLIWLSGYGSTYLVESMFDLAELARFTFAYTLSSILQITATAMNQVWSSRFFRVVHELPLPVVERRNRLFHGAQGVALGLVGAGVLLVLRPGLDMLGGNLSAYRDVGSGLFWLFAAYAVAIPWWHAQNYYYVRKQGQSLMRVVALTSVLGVVVWLVLMAALGSRGIYAGFFAMMLVRSLATWWRARSLWHIGLAWHGPVVAILLLAAAEGLAEWLWP